jgi:tetratricopeptide (TPR) repeat protein
MTVKSLRLSHTLVVTAVIAMLLSPTIAAAQPNEPGPVPPPAAESEGIDAESIVDPEEIAPDREVLLDTLYQRLQQAETPELAQAVAQSIQRVWRSSGSPTADLLLARAMSLISAQEHTLALAILDTVVVAQPEFAEGWSQRAMVHFQRRDFGSALSDLRRVLTIEPRHFRAMQGVAVILNEFGEKERALQAYRRVLDVYPLKQEARDAVEELRREVEGQDI